jgi:two-component system sensor histidine kinase HydH
VDGWYRVQSALIAAVICLALAIHVLIRARRNALWQRFAWFNFNLVVYFLVDALALSEALGPRMALSARAMVASLLPATCVSFFLSFAAEPSRWTRALRSGAQLLSLGLFASFVLGWPESAFARQWVLFAGLALALAVSLAQMMLRHRALESRVDRTRLKYVTIASAAVFSLLLLELVPGLRVASVANLLTALYMYFMFQLVTRRRLIDIFEFLGRFVVLAGFAIVLSAIYVVLVAWWRHDFGLFLFNTAIAGVVIAILFEPLRALVEEKLNQMVFREKFEFTQQIDAVRGGLATIIDVGELAAALMAHLEGSRRATHAAFYLVDEDGRAYSRLAHIGSPPTPRLDAITARLFLNRLLEQKLLPVENLEAERGELAKRGSVEEQAQLEVLDALIQTMDELQAALAIALISGDQLLGFLTVKDERLREAFSADEIKALIGLAAQATITVENSRHFDRIRERDRLAALGEMAAGLAHEIRNPLGSIKGAAQLLAEEPHAEGPYLGVITEEVERLNGVVSQFLTYARPMKGVGEWVDVNQVLARTLTLLNAADHPCEIELIAAPNLPQVRSEPELLRQVTLNLARNAIEAMGEAGGHLVISTALTRRRQPDTSRGRYRGERVSFIRIRFEDDGPGMPPEVLERLYIPFYTTKPGGTGLGLAICQRIVRSLDGTIEVSSRLGEGTTFSIYLPAADSSRVSTSA